MRSATKALLPDCPLELLTESSSSGLSRYAKLAHQITGHSEDYIKNVARTTLRYVAANGKGRVEHEAMLEAFDQWYASLETGEPDYSVYAGRHYVADLFACWYFYSRKYLCALAKAREGDDAFLRERLSSVQNALDLGCGIGYTSSVLTQLFGSSAEVTATNLLDTDQAKIASCMAEQYGFKLVASAEEAPARVDLAFASEYFEHFEQPVEHLDSVLESCVPALFVIANAFGSRSIGHFNFYKVEEGGFRPSKIPGKQMGRVFSARLRHHGYRPVNTGFWNRRPGVYSRA